MNINKVEEIVEGQEREEDKCMKVVKPIDKKVAAAINEWKRMPIDNKGYFSFKDVEKMSNFELKAVMDEFIAVRNDTSQWRNYQNRWRSALTEGVTDKVILDYGSGFGIEAREFLIQKGNKVLLADIHEDNMRAAEKVLSVYELKSDGHVLAQFDAPFFQMPKDHEKVDIFYSNGVLHHSNKIKEILKRAAEILREDGEIRLMLYSDAAWTMKTGQAIDMSRPIHEQKGFDVFVREMDQVGQYADWFNRAKMEEMVGDFLTIEFCDYITSDNAFIVFILKPKKIKKE